MGFGGGGGSSAPKVESVPPVAKKPVKDSQGSELDMIKRMRRARSRMASNITSGLAFDTVAPLNRGVLSERL